MAVNLKRPRSKTNKLPSKGRTGLHLEFPARVTATDLQFVSGLAREDWAQTTFRVAQLDSWGNWALGSCIEEGVNRYGEEAWQTLSELGIGLDKLKACHWVYKQFPEPTRIRELHWSHHRIAAGLETLEERTHWITECFKNGWAVHEFDIKLKEAGLKKSRIASKAPGLSNDEGMSGTVPLCPICTENPATVPICANCEHLAEKRWYEARLGRCKP